MDNACESPTEKAGETGESDQTTGAPGGPGATDADRIPEEPDGDGDGDLKEAAAEEGEVGRDVLVRPEEYSEIVTGCSTTFLVDPSHAKTIRTQRASFKILSRGGGWAIGGRQN